VSWIGPHFFQNDDHPPADVRAGQALVAQVYQALSRGPGWAGTLLILCYDEHGGFYDHVAPAPAADTDPAFRQYGVRVPAMVICPWVAPASVHHGVLDHTTIIKTILLRFCRSAAGQIPDMGQRVGAAAHLGALLSQAQARPAPAIPDTAIAQWGAWQAETWRAGLAAGACAAGAAAMLSAEEAGAIAADKHMAKTSKKALAANGKAAPLSISKRRRKRRRPAPPQALP
jgi:phospholipase C